MNQSQIRNLRRDMKVLCKQLNSMSVSDPDYPAVLKDLKHSCNMAFENDIYYHLTKRTDVLNPHHPIYSVTLKKKEDENE